MALGAWSGWQLWHSFVLSAHFGFIEGGLCEHLFISVMKDSKNVDLHIEFTQVSNATVVACFPLVALVFETSGERPVTVFLARVVVGACYYC